MNRILATAATEFRIALRNRWVAIAVAMMALFALVLSAAGSAPTGDLGVDRLSVTVASLTSLAVYLVPLVALLMSFDAMAGEVERGTLPLVLTYPVARAGDPAGQVRRPSGGSGAGGCWRAMGWPALAALWSGSACAGRVCRRLAAFLDARSCWVRPFLALGYALSALARRPRCAAGAGDRAVAGGGRALRSGPAGGRGRRQWRRLHRPGLSARAAGQPGRCVPALQPWRVRGDGGGGGGRRRGRRPCSGLRRWLALFLLWPAAGFGAGGRWPSER